MSEHHHKLLARQIRKHFPNGVPVEFEGFIQAVNESYNHQEADRKLMVRAMDISSKELYEKNQELESKNTSLDSFIYRVSHDLKTPSHNVISMVDLLRQQIKDLDPGPVALQILNHLESASQGMLTRLKDLLELTRMENTLDAQAEDIHLASLMGEIMESMSTSIQENNVIFDVDFKDCPKVLFGRENMRSLLSNLIGNSIKYRSLKRAPFIRVVSKRHGPWVVLTISDNGMGINLEENGNQLFGMFNRFHSHVEGTGVGLYIVKKIVDGYGGRIEVDSEVGKGTAFKLFLRNSTVPRSFESTPEPA